MDVLDQVRVCIYRFHEKGLEVFLIQNDMGQDPEIWKFPAGNYSTASTAVSSHLPILLEPIADENGSLTHVLGIEGDWHDIPSIRGMIRYDLKLVKSMVKDALPDLEKGSFFGVKDAFKRVLPNEYAALKELKDILLDRNVVQNI